MNPSTPAGWTLLALAVCAGGCGSYAVCSEAPAPRVTYSLAGADLAAPEVCEPTSAGETYRDYGHRPVVSTAVDRRSTFSVDVDTASFTLARRKLNEGVLPPLAAVRTEEFVNFFRQDYPDPRSGAFAVPSEAAPSPFRPAKTLLRIGLQGRRLVPSARKRANLVFLVDVSGSMVAPDKLDLVKESLEILTRALRFDDTVAICTYAGRVSVVLEPTPAADRERILSALDGLYARGSTAMGAGLQLAYRLAAERAGPGVNSRVLVCTDGDANVGPRSHGELLEWIDRERARGVTLGVLGFGTGNVRDDLLEQLADRGDGSYAYVDSRREAERLFGEELIPNLEVLARDVKVQVEFDPERVASYRLLGYENRAIRDRDFRNDAVDAGEVGAGHTVTALYELSLVPGSRGPLGVVHLRYEDGALPPGSPAREESISLTAAVAPRFSAASQRFRLTACAAELAQILRRSPYVETSFTGLLGVLEGSLHPGGDDRERDLVAMVRRAAAIGERANARWWSP